jgi:hypothetical protein
MDRMAADMDVAEQSILDVLPGGTAKRPDELIAAVEGRDPTIRRDIARGAIWALLNDDVIEATARGTLQRLNEAE